MPSDPEWAVSNGWKIIDEHILKEDGKIYEIIVLEKGIAHYDELELTVGPFLIAEKSDVFLEKWESESQMESCTRLAAQCRRDRCHSTEKKAIE